MGFYINGDRMNRLVFEKKLDFPFSYIGVGKL